MRANSPASRTPNNSGSTPNKSSNQYDSLSTAILARESILLPRGSAPIKRRAQQFEHECRDNPLPNTEFVRSLTSLENEARSAVGLLKDHAEEALIAETFPVLASRLDSICSGFEGMFSAFKSNSQRALTYTRLYFPNAYLVYVAYSASQDFEGDEFWKSFFEKLSLNKQVHQIEAKNIFYTGVGDRGLPRFRPDDSFHFLYTAILHGGFSESFWMPVWEKVILPHVDVRDSWWFELQSGESLFNLMRNSSDGYELERVYALRILEKASPSLVTPLLDSALQVANDLRESRRDPHYNSTAFELQTTHGLPDPAMRALRRAIEGGTASSTTHLMYFPTAELRLDLGAGNVHLHWDAMKVDAGFQGKSIEYRINGNAHSTVQVDMGVGKCVIPEKDIALPPSKRFDVELVLLDSSETRTALSTTRQEFKRTEPGTFEFVKGPDGVFRLRHGQRRFSRARTVAYLTKADYWVKPRSGMSAVSTYELAEWNGASIQVFMVEPGASGSIISLTTGDEIACWHEDYYVKLQRNHVIGKGDRGCDLFGFSRREGGFNAQLPEIVVETSDLSSIDSTKDDLRVRCQCDGKKVDLSHKLIRIDKDKRTSHARLTIDVNRAVIPSFVRNGLIQVDQKSTAKTIFKYKFSVIPVESFGLRSLSNEDGQLIAEYGFEVTDDVVTFDEYGPYEMVGGDSYTFYAPLADQSTSIEFRRSCDDEPLMVQLSLAGIDVDVPKGLRDINVDRPLTLMDADADGRIRLMAKGRRRSRSAKLSIGFSSLLYDELKTSTHREVDIFKDPAYLSYDEEEERRDVTLSVSYGEQLKEGDMASRPPQVTLLECKTGLDLGAASIVSSPYEGHKLVFKNASPTDMCLQFIYVTPSGNTARLAETTLREGERSSAIQGNVIRMLSERKDVRVLIAPMDFFGEPDERRSMSIRLGEHHGI